MNEFERVQLHPHWHGLVAVYGDFFHIIFRGTIYSFNTVGTPSDKQRVFPAADCIFHVKPQRIV